MRRLILVVIALSVPVVLTMGVVRAVTMPWYPAWAYGRSGFPEDPYGMDSEVRLRLARAAIRYLNRPRRDALLTELRLPDGSPAFNERELSHMVDVKRVYNGLTYLAAAMLVLSLSGSVYFKNQGMVSEIGRGLWRGGVLTLALMAGLALWMVVGFSAFFTIFHGVFFERGTWLFYASDTLIRLFPLPFWRDAGLLVALGVGASAVLLVIGGRALARVPKS